MKRPPLHPPFARSNSHSSHGPTKNKSSTPQRNSGGSGNSSSTTTSSSSPVSKFAKGLIVEDDEDGPYSSAQALEEAEAVMNSAGYTSGQMSSFNLLEVVTNPRGVISLPPPRTSNRQLGSSRHGGIGGGGEPPSADGNHTVSSDLLSKVPVSTESLTDTVNNLTFMLDSFSREYFGTSPMDPHSNTAMEEYEGWFYDSNDTGHLTGSALEETLGTDPLPEYLAHVDLQGLEDWLNRCCGLAFRFVARGEEDEGVIMDTYDELDDMEHQILQSRVTDNLDDDDDDGDNDNDSLSEEKEQTTSTDKEETSTDDKSKEPEDDFMGIPPIFFSPYFDLTNPQTFESLLLPKEENEKGRRSKPPSTESMLQKQETLTTYLDNIEISLLQQVRMKSHQFFRETDNFNFLKQTITESVQEVKELRETLSKIKQRAVVDAEQIPKMDNQRQALTQINSLLEKVQNVVQAKVSVSGLMASEDYLGVVEAFESARSLLDGHHLSKISALAQVKDQFQSYENIVVENMSTALVEHFLSWSSMGGEDEEEEKKMMDLATTPLADSDKMHQVKVILQALQKLNKLSIAQDLYEVRLADMVKVTVKTTVTECAADALTPTNTKQQSTASTDKSGSITAGVTSMTFPHFLNCLDMLFEQLLSVLRGAVKVDSFLKDEGIPLQQKQKQTNIPSDSSIANSSTASSALSGATELAHKSISELLRLRKDAHSLASLDEMKSLWDTCLSFTLQLEKCSHGSKAYGLRSTLLAQAKAFLERKHESCMAGLAAALDCEKWVQCDVSAERQAALTRLCSGRAAYSGNQPRSPPSAQPSGQPSNSQSSQHLNNAYIDETPYKMVWSCLLLLEFLLINVSSAAHFQTLATSCVSKIAELLRLFNSRTSQLVLGAGAIHSAARLKSINAKHLALVTQCLGLVISILPHIRAALMAQLPSKQHTLLHDLDKIKREYNDHLEKVLSKFVNIISGIVEHGLAPRISKTDFDQRGRMQREIELCGFLEGVATNTKKMHQVLAGLLPTDHLHDVFSRIFSNIDSMVPTLFMNADTSSKGKNATNSGGFLLPSTEAGKRRLVAEVEIMTKGLNSLPGVQEWEFSSMSVLKKKLELDVEPEKESEEEPENQVNAPVMGNGNGYEHAEGANDTVDEAQEEITSAEVVKNGNNDSEGTNNDVDEETSNINSVSENESSEQEATEGDENKTLVEVKSVSNGEGNDDESSPSQVENAEDTEEEESNEAT